MSETAYWVWLQCALGEGAAVQPLLEEFGSAKAVARAGVADLQAVDGISEAMARTIADYFSAKA